MYDINTNRSMASPPPSPKHQVGRHNHKYFVLFLLYVSLGTSFVASSIYAVSHLIGPVSVGVKGLMALTTVLAIVMVPFSAYHFYLVFSNQTTLEHAISIAECEPNRFSRGCCHNTASLCGDSRLWWLCPVEPIFPASTVYKTEQFSV